MAGLGRLQPFVAVTQSNAFAMPAKGSLRPETVIHWGHAQGPLTDQKADIRANCCGAQEFGGGYVSFAIPKWKKLPVSDFVA
jgi:hypothetical protein